MTIPEKAASTTTANSGVTTTTGVTTTAGGNPGSGIIVGDPHVKVQVPGQDPICFDLHPDQISAKFNLLEDKLTRINVYGVFEKDLKMKHSRLSKVEVLSDSLKASVTKSEVMLNQETYSLSDDTTVRIGDVEVKIESLESSRIPGVTFIYDSGVVFHVTSRTQSKSSIGFSVVESKGLGHSLGGIIGHQINPHEYDVKDGVIFVEGRKISDFSREWIDHSYCNVLSGEAIFEFLGKTLDDFQVLEAKMIHHSDPK